MVLCGTKNGSSMASLEEPFEAPLFLRVYNTYFKTNKIAIKKQLYTTSLKKFGIRYLMLLKKVFNVYPGRLYLFDHEYSIFNFVMYFTI